MPSINKIRVNGTDYDIEPSQTHSSTEKVIGIWVDNKPIYEQVITFTKADIQALSLDSNNRRVLPYSNRNIDTLVDARFGLYTIENEVRGHLISNIGGGANWDMTLYNVTDTYTELGIGTNMLDITINGFLVLQYTKTTD